jgi:hypothetical protein
MRSIRSWLDLLIATVLAVLALVASLLPLDSWARALVVIPFLIWAPGFALLSVLFPDPSGSRGERAVYTVALSFIVIALSGVCLQLVWPLNRTSWAILIVSVTLLACLISLARGLVSRRPPRPRPIPYLSLRSLAMFAAAIALAGGSVAIAAAGARRHQADAHFTALWAVPKAAARAARQWISVGMESQEADTSDYTLLVTRGTTRLLTENLRLEPGRTWESALSLPRGEGRGRITVTLQRGGSVLHRVYLDDSS